jgi:hypothetical protein
MMCKLETMKGLLDNHWQCKPLVVLYNNDGPRNAEFNENELNRRKQWLEFKT